MTVVDEFETLSEKLARAVAESESLRAENEHLRQLLARTGLSAHAELEASKAPEPELWSSPVIRNFSKSPNRSELPVPEKIALFRFLFRGREYVYAVRWERPDGKSGYSPAGVRDWKALEGLSLFEKKTRQSNSTPVASDRRSRVSPLRLPNERKPDSPSC